MLAGNVGWKCRLGMSVGNVGWKFVVIAHNNRYEKQCQVITEKRHVGFMARGRDWHCNDEWLWFTESRIHRHQSTNNNKCLTFRCTRMHASKVAFSTTACRKLFVSGHCRCGDRQIVSLESRRHFSIGLKSQEWSRKDGMNLARDSLSDSAEGVSSRHWHLLTSKRTCAICTMQLKAL